MLLLLLVLVLCDVVNVIVIASVIVLLCDVCCLLLGMRCCDCRGYCYVRVVSCVSFVIVMCCCYA